MFLMDYTKIFRRAVALRDARLSKDYPAQIHLLKEMLISETEWSIPSDKQINALLDDLFIACKARDLQKS